MGVEKLIEAIAWATAETSLVAIVLCALSWTIGTLLKSAPLPKKYKDFGRSLVIDAVEGLFWLSVWTAVSSLISWIAYVISLAA